MKKSIILIIGCLIFLVTGCGDKKLDCTKKQEVSGNTVQQNIIVSFSGDKVSKIEKEIETQLNEQYAEYSDIFVTQIENQFQDYKNKKGITTNITTKDNSVIFSLVINVDEMDTESKNVIGFMNPESNYNDAKKNLEENDYMCK